MRPTRILLERGKMSYIKYVNVTARATRQALKEEERIKAERRGDLNLKYQEWKNGKGSESKWFREPTEAEQHK